MILLALLFAIGFLTKSSTEYSRLIIMSWAILTPIPLIVVSVLLHEGVRRFMHSPSNARRAIVAGYNDVSRELVRRLTVNREFGISLAAISTIEAPRGLVCRLTSDCSAASRTCLHMSEITK